MTTLGVHNVKLVRITKSKRLYPDIPTDKCWYRDIEIRTDDSKQGDLIQITLFGGGKGKIEIKRGEEI